MNCAKSLLLIAIALIVFSCKDNSSGPSTTSGFTLKISVKDSHGSPVANLRVSGGNLLPMGNAEGGQAWVNELFIARLVARDTSLRTVVFRDSILMVLADADQANPLSWLGQTSNSGELVLSDVNRFPGILSIPQIPLTQNDPTPLMYFPILDTVILIIRDTVTQRQQTERRVLFNGTNIIEVQWSPSQATSLSVADPISLGIQGEHANASMGNPATSRAGSRLNVMNETSLVGTTTISFDVATRASVAVTILHLDGTTISSPLDQNLDAGSYRLQWKALTQGVAKVHLHTQLTQPSKTLTSWKLGQNYPNPFN
jgi:hypothetical protein